MSVSRILLLCSAVVMVSFVAVACGRTAQQTGGGDKTSAAVPSRIIELSDSLLQTGAVNDTIDLGRMYEGEVIRRDLAIRNEGKAPFLLLEVRTSCGCTQVDFYKQPIQPDELVPFSFEFDSRGFNGYQLKHITIRTSLGSQPYTLVVTGEVVPQS